MLRRALLVAALGVLVAGCGSSTSTTTVTVVKPPQHKTKQRGRPTGPPVKLLVTVLDGDRRARVAGATVHVFGQQARTDRNGQAKLFAPAGKLVVRVTRRGYSPLRVLADFRHTRHQTLRIYDPRLQWPIYGVTPARTQAQTHIRLRPPFHVVWSAGMGRLIEFPAAVSDGFAYIGNARGTIRAVSMRSGKVAWLHETPDFPRMASSVAVWGDAIVYHTMGGWVYVLDRATGRLRWGWNAGSAVESSPVVRHGIDYFGTAAGAVDALDLHRHRLRWSRSLGAKITSSAAIAHGRLFIGDYAGRIWALSPATGRTRWVGSVGGEIYGTPAVSGGRVFVPSVSNSMSAFSVTGRRLWRDYVGNYVYSSPAVWRGHVCFGSYDGWFYGVSARSGSIEWKVPAGGPISGAATIVAGIAYAGSLSHRIIGVNVGTGKEVFRFPHGEFVPLSGNGMRLLLDGYARLYAVEPVRRRHGS